MAHLLSVTIAIIQHAGKRKKIFLNNSGSYCTYTTYPSNVVVIWSTFTKLTTVTSSRRVNGWVSEWIQMVTSFHFIKKVKFNCPFLTTCKVNRRTLLWCGPRIIISANPRSTDSGPWEMQLLLPPYTNGQPCSHMLTRDFFCLKCSRSKFESKHFLLVWWRAVLRYLELIRC